MSGLRSCLAPRWGQGIGEGGFFAGQCVAARLTVEVAHFASMEQKGKGGGEEGDRRRALSTLHCQLGAASVTWDPLRCPCWRLFGVWAPAPPLRPGPSAGSLGSPAGTGT